MAGLRLGPFRYFMPDEEKKQDRQQRIHSHETQQAEQTVPCRNIAGKALICPHQSVDQPRLAADFRRDPTSRVGDEGKWEREHHKP